MQLAGKRVDVPVIYRSVLRTDVLIDSQVYILLGVQEDCQLKLTMDFSIGNIIILTLVRSMALLSVEDI